MKDIEFLVIVRTLKLSVVELFPQFDIISKNKIKIMQVQCIKL